jgi:hypothetical protein
MKRSTLYTLLTGAIALTFAATAFAQTTDETPETPPAPPAFVDADGDGIPDGSARRHRRHAMMRSYGAAQHGQTKALVSQLDETKKAEVKALIDGMKAEGKTREEVHAAVGAQLESYGLTLPTTWSQTPKEFADARSPLNETQRTELKTLVDGMKAEGKTREEVKVAVDAKFTEWGIEKPVHGMPGPKGRAPRGRAK